MLIHGERREGTEKIEVYSPYSGECVGQVARCGSDIVPEVIEAAESGAAIMKKMSARERADILSCAAAKLLEQKEQFAGMLVKEVGKTIRDARKEVERAANTLRLSAEAAGQICGEVIPIEQSGDGVRIGFYKRVPVGIVLAVTPFNFPLNLACHKIGPAFAAGNAVILKPASRTPLVTMMLGELFFSCGLPKDALTIVCGPGGELGNAEMKAYAQTVRWGNPSDAQTDLGPMISSEALNQARVRIQKFMDMGAELVTGNTTEGNILLPTILRDAPENAPVIQEEMFAPVITINGYDSLEEAIGKVNGTPYGLQAAILTDNTEEALRFAEETDCGGVIVNDTCNYRVDEMPYGGLKNSGIGKEGPGFAIKEMTEMKMIVINGKLQGA